MPPVARAQGAGSLALAGEQRCARERMQRIGNGALWPREHRSCAAREKPRKAGLNIRVRQAPFGAMPACFAEAGRLRTVYFLRRRAARAASARMLSVVACLGVERAPQELLEAGWSAPVSASGKAPFGALPACFAEAGRLRTVYFLRRRAARAASARMLSVVVVGSGMALTSKYTPTLGTLGAAPAPAK